MSAFRPVSTGDPGVPSPCDGHSLSEEADGPLHTADDDMGQSYTLWEKFLTHTDASTWLATSPARSARPM